MKRNKRVEILLTQEEYERIEKVAKKLNMPISRVIRNLTMAGLEDAELLNNIGAFDLIKLIEKLREKALGTRDLKLANW